MQLARCRCSYENKPLKTVQSCFTKEHNNTISIKKSYESNEFPFAAFYCVYSTLSVFIFFCSYSPSFPNVYRSNTNQKNINISNKSSSRRTALKTVESSYEAERDHDETIKPIHVFCSVLLLLHLLCILALSSIINNIKMHCVQVHPF